MCVREVEINNTADSDIVATYVNNTLLRLMKIANVDALSDAYSGISRRTVDYLNFLLHSHE